MLLNFCILSFFYFSYCKNIFTEVWKSLPLMCGLQNWDYFLNFYSQVFMSHFQTNMGIFSMQKILFCVWMTVFFLWL